MAVQSHSKLWQHWTESQTVSEVMTIEVSLQSHDQNLGIWWLACIYSHHSLPVSCSSVLCKLPPKWRSHCIPLQPPPIPAFELLQGLPHFSNISPPLLVRGHADMLTDEEELVLVHPGPDWCLDAKVPVRLVTCSSFCFSFWFWFSLQSADNMCFPLPGFNTTFGAALLPLCHRDNMGVSSNWRAQDM